MQQYFYGTESAFILIETQDLNKRPLLFFANMSRVKGFSKVKTFIENSSLILTCLTLIKHVKLQLSCFPTLKRVGASLVTTQSIGNVFILL